MEANARPRRHNFSALFTLLDCLDLSEQQDPKVVHAIVSMVRTIAGPGDRFSRAEVQCIKVYGGFLCSGECDAAGWKRLVIKTGKHEVEILPL